jgi:hypothetical protein
MYVTVHTLGYIKCNPCGLLRLRRAVLPVEKVGKRAEFQFGRASQKMYSSPPSLGGFRVRIDAESSVSPKHMVRNRFWGGRGKRMAP